MKAGHWLRWSAACVLYYGGIIAALRRASRRGPASVLVLRYHRILRDPSKRFYRLGVPGRVFERQVAYLRRHYPLIGLEEAGKLLSGGTLTSRNAGRAAPDGRRGGGGSGAPQGRFIVLTFDDGYADNLPTASVLAADGVPVVIFIVTGAVDSGRPFFWERLATLFERSETLRRLPARGRRARFDRDRSRLKRLSAPEREAELERLAAESGVTAAQLEHPHDRPMCWDEVRALQRAGVAIGAHTATHPLLTLLTDAEIVEEVAGSVRKLKETLGVATALFAYPTGDQDARVRRLTGSCGIRLAVTCEGGVNATGQDPLALRRKGVGERVGQTPLGGFSRALWAAEVEGVFDGLRLGRRGGAGPEQSLPEGSAGEAAG